MNGIGFSMTSSTSASLDSGPVPWSGCVVGKFKRSTRSVSVTGSASSSASRTSSATDSGLRPALLAKTQGFSAFTSHSAMRRASVGSGHAGRAIPSSSRVGKRIFLGSCNIAVTRYRQVNRSLRFAHRDLQQTTDDQTRIVLVFETMIELGVLPDDLALVARLLHPLDGPVARSRHGTWVGARAGAGGDQHGVTAAPRAVQRGAVIQGADIDVRRRDRRLAGNHRAAKRRVERNAFVRHRDQLGNGPAAHLRLGDTLLIKGDFSARNKKYLFHAAQLHRRNQRIRPLFGVVFLPARIES